MIRLVPWENERNSRPLKDLTFQIGLLYLEWLGVQLRWGQTGETMSNWDLICKGVVDPRWVRLMLLPYSLQALHYVLCFQFPFGYFYD